MTLGFYPSGGLTKSFETREMLINWEREVGLVYGLDTNSFLSVKSFLSVCLFVNFKQASRY